MWFPSLKFCLVPGDCGAWVLDAISGALYGHIVAGNSSLHRAYIVPAVDVMEDIRIRFRHYPILPKTTPKGSKGKSFQVAKDHIRRRSLKPEDPVVEQPTEENVSHRLWQPITSFPTSATLRSRLDRSQANLPPPSYLHTSNINVDFAREQPSHPSLDLELPCSETTHRTFIHPISRYLDEYMCSVFQFFFPR